MPKKKKEPVAVNLRLDADLLDRIDRAAATLSERAGGLPVTRPDAIRTLLTRACIAVEEAELTS